MTGWSLLATPAFAAWVVAISVACAGWQARRMLRRSPVRRRRIAALLIGIGALALLALEPARRGPSATRSAVLITDLPEAADEPSDGVDGALARYVLADAVRARDEAGGDVIPEAATIVPDAAWLARRGDLDRLRLVGHGLEPGSWPADAGVRIEVAPPAPTPGVTRIAWPREVVVGVPFRVAGHLVGLAEGDLVLRDPGGRLPATETARPAANAISDPRDGTDGPVATEAARPFAVSATARAPGQWVYELVLTRPAAPPRSLGTLGVRARRPDLPRVLWLESAPGFETRHLKAWLIAEGGALGVRTAISRERFRFERHNLPDLDLARLTPSLLDAFDLVVAEERFLATLGERAEGVLHAAIEGGLGLLVRPGATPDPRAWYALPGRAVAGLADKDEDDGRMPTRVAWSDGVVSTPLSGPAREIVLGDDAVRPLLSDPQGRVLAGSRRVGAGQIGGWVLEDTYRWVLDGKPGFHRRAWSTMLGALARGRAAPRALLPAGPLFVDRRVPITLDVGDRDPAAPPRARLVTPDGATRDLAWRQDLVDATRWHSVFWPDLPGWHRLEVDGATVAVWRVVEAGAWPTVNQVRRQEASARLAVRSAAVERAAVAGVWTPHEPTRIALLLLATAAFALLWIDERLADPS